MKRETRSSAMLCVLAGLAMLFVAACNPDQEKLPAKPSQGFGAAPGKNQDADPALPGSKAASVDLPADGASVRSNDGTLADRVKASITSEPALGSVSLDVTERNGVVTLHGTVATDSERERAGRVASSVAGVQSVNNELVIIRGS